MRLSAPIPHSDQPWLLGLFPLFPSSAPHGTARGRKRCQGSLCCSPPRTPAAPGTSCVSVHTHTGQGMEKPVLPSCLMLLQCLWSSLEAAGQCSTLEQLCCTKETKSEIPPTSESSTQPTAPHNVPFSPLELKPLVRTWVSGLPKCHQTAKYCLMPAPAFHA